MLAEEIAEGFGDTSNQTLNIENLGPKVTGISHFRVSQEDIVFLVEFRDQSQKDMGLVDGKDMKEVLTVKLGKSYEDSESVEIVSVNPEKAAKDQSSYLVTVKLPPVDDREAKLQLFVNTRWRDLKLQFIERNLPWVTAQLEALRGQVDPDLKVLYAALQNTPIPTDAITTLANKLSALNGEAGKALNVNSVDLRNPYRDASTRSLVTELSAETSRFTPDDRFLLLLWRFQGYRIARERSQPKKKELTDEVLKEVDNLSPVFVEFTFEGRIKGFITLPNRMQVVPRKEVHNDFGEGVDKYFVVVRVPFVNDTEDDLLIYGENLKIPIYYLEFSYNSNSSYRKLIHNDFRKKANLFVDKSGDSKDPCDIGTADKCLWCFGERASRTTREGGKVFRTKKVLYFAPIPLRLAFKGFDLREFNTRKKWFLRITDGIISAASGLIPVIDKPDYNDWTGAIGGIFVPAMKEILGDATPQQRQTFVEESLGQYLELKVGQTINKVVYLPRYGIDVTKTGRVIFVSEVGKDQELMVRAAKLEATQ